MASRSTSTRSRLRALLAVVGALAGAALFGAVVASVLTVSDARFRPSPQNPFDSSRSVQ
ncbi:hypothetical protein [Methylopila sp. M107]|uniref:hypothetical protein n=1 Tax=Methylopila sp. M107 TaxID=1101190 RepID=UPI0003639595|nr:hypothetical protein [Methylopila sp. M107]